MADKKIRRSSVRRKGFSLARLKHIKALSVIAKAAIYFLLVCIGFVYLRPIFEMISKSLMDSKDLVDPSITWLPKHFTISNFRSAADTLKLKESLFNSAWISALFALAQTVVSATTGFALSRYKFRGRGFWFGMIILGFILPVPLLTVPRIIIFQFIESAIDIKMFATVYPQLIMSILGQGTYSTILILIFYNFFNMIPTSLDEAAMIDGAGALKVFYHIAIRLSLSTILVVFMFSFVFNWNERYTTTCFLSDSKYALLPYKLSSFEGDLAKTQDRVNEAYQMAATLISIAPLLFLYAIVQRQFIEGIENAGITGE